VREGEDGGSERASRRTPSSSHLLVVDREVDRAPPELEEPLARVAVALVLLLGVGAALHAAWGSVVAMAS
jgi:hypothetical protein